MREYRIKRGYEASNSRLEELLKKYFGNFTFENGCYVVRGFGGIEEMRAKLERKALFIETKTRIVDEETSIKTIRAYNSFLEEFTGVQREGEAKDVKERSSNHEKVAPPGRSTSVLTLMLPSRRA